MTILINREKYTSLLHTQNLLQHLSQTLPSGEHVLILLSHDTPFRDDTDRELPHRTESNFMHLTGCQIPNAAVKISFTLPLQGPEAFRHELYIPPTDPATLMWSIPPPDLTLAQQLYESHSIDYLPSLLSSLSSLVSSSPSTTIHTLPQTPLFPPFPPDVLIALSPSSSTDAYLLPALHRSRLLKTPHEIKLMEKAVDITSAAHTVVMRELGRYAASRGGSSSEGVKKEEKEGGEEAKVRSATLGLSEWEIQAEGDAEAVFTAVCRRNEAKHLAYMPIVASGPRASTLHYICNHERFSTHPPLLTTMDAKAFISSSTPTPTANGHAASHDHSSSAQEKADVLRLGELKDLKGAWKPQVLLIDAGAEWECYSADVTRTMPVGNGGKFTPEAAEIYDLVLHMQKSVESAARPSVHWDTLHLLCHTLLVKRFLELGIFRAEYATPEGERQILESGVTTGFLPHGLGHSLGCDVHDVPSASKPTENSTIPAASLEIPQIYAYLRLRLPLQTGMVVTIEPGCYFSPHLLAPWRDSPYIDPAVLARYEPVGGVRLEDVVVVEETGVRNLTWVVREREEVEGLCSGKA